MESASAKKSAGAETIDRGCGKCKRMIKGPKCKEISEIIDSYVISRILHRIYVVYYVAYI